MFFDLVAGVLLLLFAGRNFGEHHMNPFIGLASAAGGVYFILSCISIALHQCMVAGSVPGVLM
jgi:hypothetical protein